MDVCALRLLPNNTFGESEFVYNRPSEPRHPSSSYTFYGTVAKAYLLDYSELPKPS
jgi:hypothetical protein